MDLIFEIPFKSNKRSEEKGCVKRLRKQPFLFVNLYEIIQEKAKIVQVYFSVY